MYNKTFKNLALTFILFICSFESFVELFHLKQKPTFTIFFITMVIKYDQLLVKDPTFFIKK